jgi:hypothetical protein
VPHRNIEQTIQHAIGLEKSHRKDMEKGSQMYLRIIPGLWNQPRNPLEEYIWIFIHPQSLQLRGTAMLLYLLIAMVNSDVETLIMAKRWVCPDLRAKYPLLRLVVVRDNSEENTLKELNDFFTENGIKNYFSAPYEQWQNEMVTMLGKTGMAE